MRKKTAVAFWAILTFAGVGAGADEPKAYEMPRTQVVPIKDSTANRQYELYIRLPEGYAENTDIKYPVIYATDAVWHMDMLSGATEYLMPNVIVAHNINAEFFAAAHSGRILTADDLAASISNIKDEVCPVGWAQCANW